MLSGEAAEPGRPGDGAGEPGIPGAALLNLVAVMDRLRRECPWDARQTHESLAPFLLEETYEAVEALEQRDLAKLREELGDVLLQVLFHARVAAERTDGTGFTIDDVADGIADKLIRRHPHVFADVTVTGPDEVKLNWDAIKARERAAAGGPVSALDGVPMGQPALSLAAQLQRRAERAGVPADLASLPVRSPAGSGVAESGLAESGLAESGSAESGQAPAAAAPAVPGGESVSPVAAELFDLVARARAAGLDPELELRHASTVYRDLVRGWEQQEPG